MIEMKKRTDYSAGRKAGIAVAIGFGTIAFFAGGWVVIPMLLGVLAAILGVLAVALVLASPFLVLGFGVYGAVHLSQRRRAPAVVPATSRPIAASAVPYELVSPAVAPAPVVAAPAAAPTPAAAPAPAPRAELPVPIQTQAQRIEGRARELLGRTGHGAIGQEDRALVQRALDDYLPQALKAFRALPPGSGQWAVTADGKTGAQMLQEQLDLIEQSLQQVEVRIWRSGAERMLAQQRFLEQRIGPAPGGDEDDELRLPPR